MKKLKWFTPALFFCFFFSCKSTAPAKDVKGILTAEPWYFFSIDGGEAYDCVKQTQMNFLPDGTLEIDTYIRTPQYTCEGPVRTSYAYTLTDNNTKIAWGDEVFAIVHLTDTEFIKRTNRDGKEHTWVYRRYK